MNGILLSLLGYLGGDLLAAILARLGIRGFVPPAGSARKGASAPAKSALDRLLARADRDLPDAELAQHLHDRETVKAASRDWFA